MHAQFSWMLEKLAVVHKYHCARLKFLLFDVLVMRGLLSVLLNLLMKSY